jgi:HlyD family secretion protein
MNEEQKHPKKRKTFLLVLLLVVIAAVGIASWRMVEAGAISMGQPTEAAASKYKTTTVRRDNLAVSISGSGSVISAESEDLRFSINGTVGEVYVQPGDEVTKGQVLATLADTAQLKQAILDQTLAVQVAEENLHNLLTGGPAALAQAQADQATAAQAYAEAQKSVHDAGDARCAVSKTQEYYFRYLYAQQAVNEWEGYLNDGNTGYGRDFILEKLRPLHSARDKALSNYTYCQSYTGQEIETSQANLKLAKAKLDSATAKVQNLLESSGVNQEAVAIAEATLENAKLQLSKAQAELAGTTITAPMDGTVMTVNGKVGDEVDTSTLITLSDLEQPQVQVNIDEVDLENFATGCAVDITFDSLPGETFTGVVTQVSPVVVSVNSSPMIQGLVELQQKQTASGKNLAVGLTASVEVTCKQAKDALVVPAQALYEPKGKPAYVYVLNEAGQPEKREVAIGLQTVASAEVTSGLSEGEKIITSQIESK